MHKKIKTITLFLTLAWWGCSCQAAPQRPTQPQIETASPLPPPPLDFAKLLIFEANGDLYATHANGAGREQLTSTPNYEGMPAWSPDGTLLAFVSETQENQDIVVAPVTSPGNPQTQINITQGNGKNLTPAWSPDGRKIAFASKQGNNWGIFVIDLFPELGQGIPDGFSAQRLSYNMFFDGHPAWSPDGTHIAYTSERGSRWQIFVMDADGTGHIPFPGTENLKSTAYPAWSPDGEQLAFSGNQDGTWEIYTLSSDGATLTQITYNRTTDWSPQWSSDGEWLTFVAHSDNHSDLHLIKADGSDESQISSENISELYPIWQP